MHLSHLWLQNFRNYTDLDLTFAPEGLTVITGRNGQGKTSLLESIAYVSTRRSFRRAVPETLIKVGSTSAIARGLGERGGRELLIEMEIASNGRSRALLNKQALRRSSDLADSLLTTVFSPDDLELVKGGPAERRAFVDDLLADADKNIEALQREMERVLRQRNTLLRQAAGRLTDDIALTLDVWDAKLTVAGETLGTARSNLVDRLQPYVAAAYEQLAGEEPNRVGMRMVTEWREQDGGKGLSAALSAVRRTDIQRGVTTIGPHRDELALTINGMPARTHASQGEQRTLALALRLAGHRLLADVSAAPPILLLDDVFSELDDDRAGRLLSQLPAGQAFLTTATDAPAGSTPVAMISIEHGAVVS